MPADRTVAAQTGAWHVMPPIAIVVQIEGASSTPSSDSLRSNSGRTAGGIKDGSMFMEDWTVILRSPVNPFRRPP